MKFKKTVYNLIFGIGTQLITLALGLVIPRLILQSYGSEVNGLFNTLNNIYTYLSLVEAGIATSALQALYGPVTREDHQSINEILTATKRYFHRCAMLYGLGVLVLTASLPFLLRTDISPTAVALVTLLQGCASILNFYVVAGMTALLSAEGKEYVQNNLTLVTTVLTSLAKIVLVNLRVNIVILQLAYFGISLLSVTVYFLYFRRHYPWMDRNQYNPQVKLQQRGAFLLHHVVYVIFNNTDVVLLGLLCGLKVSSVYSIYNLVFFSVLRVINTAFSGVKFNLGLAYNTDKEKYLLLHDTYNTCYLGFVFGLMTVCYLLTPGFIGLYTAGITDIAYLDPYLPMLFCLCNLFSCSRSTENNLISLAFHATQTIPRAIAEAVINLSVSVLLVWKLGIYGCLLGTLAALLYRTNDIIIYGNKTILGRSPRRSYTTVLTYFALFFAIAFLGRLWSPNITGYGSFLLWGLLLTPISLALYYTLGFLTNPTSARFVGSVLKGKLHRGTGGN